MTHPVPDITDRNADSFLFVKLDEYVSGIFGSKSAFLSIGLTNTSLHTCKTTPDDESDPRNEEL